MGYEDHELLNTMQSYEQLMVPEDKHMVRLEMEKHLASNSGLPFTQEIRFVHKSRRIVWVLLRRKGILNRENKLVRMVGTLTDITHLKINEQSLEKLAYKDYLTQASNRLAFSDALQRAIARAKRKQTRLAVMYLDIDDFKQINDQFGHDFGDAVLCEVTHTLKNASRTVDFLARLGGDEFGIILEDILNEAEVLEIAARYISSFTNQLSIQDQQIMLTISIGIAMFPAQGTSEQALLKYADNNLYLSKKRGKNQFTL